jgi:ribosomal protein S9
MGYYNKTIKTNTKRKQNTMKTTTITTNTRPIDSYYTQNLAIVESMSVNNMTWFLKSAEIKGRSKATTRALKINLIMTAYYGYPKAPIAPTAPIAPKAPKAAKAPKAKKAPVTRASLAKIANVYGWEVLGNGDQFIIRHERARADRNMATAKSLTAIAKKLKSIISEFECLTVDNRISEFYGKYYA